eukprot:TRINITY_DN26043_c0_g1_i1.p1 TRINITY_DN26043_c0_g1~~TRINITY_DN26043_c0_g1_i1.p1  ORF type:complete len:318 (+),score=147.19 TRINITY_DN26043_c0_g1_i1:186-1139(+)
MADKGGYSATPAPSGGLVDLMSDVMEVPEEKTKEELAAMSKEERTAYYKVRMAASKAKAAPKSEVSKKEKAQQAREKQEADRKKKEDAKSVVDVNAEALAELKLQGLTEEQAREVLREMEAAKAAEAAAEDSDEEGDETLLDSVRTWMKENESEKTDADSLRDFNLKVRFQGHVESTPPDHLECILQVMAMDSYKSQLLDLKQPSAVEKKMAPTVRRLAYLIGELYKKCDVLEAAEKVTWGVNEGVAQAGDDVAAATRDIAVVGILMSLREEVEIIGDEELLQGCKKLESDSKVMKGFITFLEEAAEDSDEEESGDD